MRIAIAQMRMRPTCVENTEAVLGHLCQAKDLNPDVVLFPECSTTGYHRMVPDQVSRRGIDEALARIRTACSDLQLAAVVGTPYYPEIDAAEIWNAAVVIDTGGEILAVCPKIGLTTSERRFFTAGADRPTFSLGSFACSLLLCREVRDSDQIVPGAQSPRVTFWPGVIGWESEVEDEENVVTPAIASASARAMRSYLVQCNWPNSVNNPQLAGMGGSLVFTPSGELLHECPRDAVGVFAVEV